MNSINIINIEKTFKIKEKSKSFLDLLKNKLTGRNNKKTIWANKEINFQAYPGEIIGIIGQNSAGKTTLFRMISKIYLPTNGKIETNGKIVSIINLKKALRENLTMIDNIYLFGCLFGMTRKEIKHKIKSIIKQSELEKFKETKVDNFSEGMKERLVLSLAFNADFEILLLDEIFTSVDKKFLDKNKDILIDLKKKNKTILLISHNLDIIKKYCDRIIWMEKGKINKIGHKEILEEYGK